MLDRFKIDFAQSEIAHDEPFLLLPQCFQRSSASDVSKKELVTINTHGNLPESSISKVTVNKLVGTDKTLYREFLIDMYLHVA